VALVSAWGILITRRPAVILTFIGGKRRTVTHAAHDTEIRRRVFQICALLEESGELTHLLTGSDAPLAANDILEFADAYFTLTP
jgi:hypothetical protein